MFALSAFSTYDSTCFLHYEAPVDTSRFDSVQNMKRSSYTVHIILKGPSEPDQICSEVVC
jgi:hypothetical protein